MQKTNKNLDEFASRAADQAMRGAVNYLVPVGTRPNWTDEQIESLLVFVRAEIKEALLGALKDAQDAFACGMGGFASATFGASMMIAGTTAAKKWKGETK